ncbi:Gfo/Idh/MocA family protein [Streptomyces globisporus]
MTEIAVLGAGRIGSLHAENLLAHDPGLDLVIHDSDAAAGQALADRLGARFVASAVEALSVRDALVIATPSQTHPGLIAAGVERGLTVFCEKPIATTSDQALGIAELVRDAGGRVQVGFQRRCDPAYTRLRDAVSAGEAGDPLFVRTTAFDRDPPPAEFFALSGGFAADCVVHDLDAVPWLTGRRIRQVYADGAVLTEGPYAEHDDHDVLTVLLTLEGGVRAVLTASRTQPHGYDHRVEVMGTKGALSAGLTPRTPLTPVEGTAPGEARAEPYDGFVDRFAEAYAAEMAAFVALCRDEGANPCPIGETLDAMRAVEATRRSLRTGQRVRLA